ncbi:MAG: hypothetical protein N2053_02430 [Chitinispirillaceae bacterium]|nr:hypothetical protein [Chitinispirillaceae bacterium]
MTDSTSPIGEKYPFISSSVVVKGRFPTYNLLDTRTSMKKRYRCVDT